jgi:glycosyltransferase involved in cell wall biosynthesis
MKKRIEKKPTVSIVMPVYNTEKYVEEAVISVLRQTFTDWELIIMDDGSQDKSPVILRKICKIDKRIKCILSPKNRGIGETMTDLVRQAQGKYIARMDSDDIMLSSRIETQVKFLQDNPSIGVVGSYLAELDGNRKLRAVRKVPVAHGSIVAGLFTRQTIQNPTLMIRVSAIPQKEMYFNSQLSPVDDLDFYMRVARAKVKFANIPQYLMYYRAHGKNSSLVDIKKSYRLSNQVRERALLKSRVSLGFGQSLISTAQKLVVNILPNNILYTIYKFWQGSGVNGAVVAPVKGPREFGISIVMPIYQGEQLVKESVERVISSMRSTQVKFELIVVVDGVIDKTEQKLKKMITSNPELKILSYPDNRGKGYAVRYGMGMAKMSYVGYMDAGHDIDINSLIHIVSTINDNRDVDVFVADKLHPMSQIVNVPYFRKVYSYGFRHFVAVLFGSKMGDTQVGLKFFRSEIIKKLLKENAFIVNRFSFDVELMNKLTKNGSKILHVPVVIRRNGEKSSVGILDVLGMIWDVVRLRFAL